MGHDRVPTTGFAGDLALASRPGAWHHGGTCSSPSDPHTRARRMTRPQLGVTPRQGALALAAGLLGAAAFWPLALWPLLLVSIALFLRLLRDQDTQTARNVGLVYGLAFAAGTMYWMFWVFGTTAVPLLAIMAAYFGLLATLVGLTRGLPVPAR